MVVFTIGINRWSLFYPSDGNIAGRDLDLDDTVPINCQQVKRIRAFRWHSNQLLGTESCKSSDKVATIKWLLFWISLYFWWFAFRSKSEFYIIILFVARRLPLVLSIIITTRTSNYVSVATEITTSFFRHRFFSKSMSSQYRRSSRHWSRFPCHSSLCCRYPIRYMGHFRCHFRCR